MYRRVEYIGAIQDVTERRLSDEALGKVRSETLIREIGDVVLVIIDPVTAYMGKIDSHKNTDVRAVLAEIGLR